MNTKKLIKLLEAHGFDIMRHGNTWQGTLRTPQRRGMTGALRTVVQWFAEDKLPVDKLEAYAYAGPKGREGISFKLGIDCNAAVPFDKISRIIEACMP